MMPWEHVLVAYIGYSFFVHAAYGGPPTSRETLVVALATLLPDLVDKPLAWEFGVFASGYAVAHSILVALPVSIGVGWIVSVRGRPRIGWAFAMGYLLHPVADVVPEYLRSGDVRLDWILWPVVRTGDGYDAGFAGEFRSNVAEYVHWIGTQVVSGAPDRTFVAVLGVVTFGVLLWVYDGMPVGREAVRAVRRGARKLVRSVVG